jgi:hypothetical protein
MLPPRLLVRGMFMVHDALGPGPFWALTFTAPLWGPAVFAATVLLVVPAVLCLPLVPWLAVVVAAARLARRTLQSAAPPARRAPSHVP